MIERTDDGRDRPRRDAWWLVLIVFSALAIRGVVPYEHVITEDSVSFRGNDAWYHARLVDNLVHNFPRPLTFDPYAAYPGGQDVGVAPLLDLVTAGVALILGMGSPSQRTIDLVAAWMPAVLGALVPLAVYLAGRRLFGARAGLIGAALVAIQPGQLLARSLLGFYDHHVAEALLSTLILAALFAVTGRVSETPTDKRAGHRAAIVAGIALGAYLASWSGGTMLIGVLLAWSVLQALIDHATDRGAGRLAPSLSIMAAAASITLLPLSPFLPRLAITVTALSALAVVPWVLALLGRLTIGRRVLLPVVVLTSGVLGWWAASWLLPSLTDQIVGYLARFVPSATSATVSEAQPLFAETVDIRTALDVIWQHSRLAFGLGIVALGVLVARVIRGRGPAGETLLMVWSLAMLGATMSQNRFGYYLDVVLALLIGMLVHLVLGARLRGSPRVWLRAVAAGVLVAAAFLPVVQPVLATATSPQGPGDAWIDALTWLRENTPEPYGDPAAYERQRDFGPDTDELDDGLGLDDELGIDNELGLNGVVADGGAASRVAVDGFTVDRAYGVLTWWDYGYWITRIGRRIPIANPTQRGAETAAAFFTASDLDSAMQVLDDTGTRYVITHADLALWPDPHSGLTFGLLPTMAVWDEQSLADYYEIYWEAAPDGRLYPTVFYYPEFYRTMAMRLVLFAGEEVRATDTYWAIRWYERPWTDGTMVKEILAARQFHTHEEALTFIAERPSGQWRLAGRDPRYPCVPLEAVSRLREVHHAPSVDFPLVRIFEVGEGER